MPKPPASAGFTTRMLDGNWTQRAYRLENEMDNHYSFLATHFGIQDIKYQAGNEFAWNSVLDTQACIIEAGYNISVTARRQGTFTDEVLDRVYETLLAQIQANLAQIPPKDAYWEESMRCNAALDVVTMHRNLVRQVAKTMGPALATLYRAMGEKTHPGLDPETYFREKVVVRVFKRT